LETKRRNEYQRQDDQRRQEAAAERRIDAQHQHRQHHHRRHAGAGRRRQEFADIGNAAAGDRLRLRRLQASAINTGQRDAGSHRAGWMGVRLRRSTP
jgi:hypothetical protein